MSVIYYNTLLNPSMIILLPAAEKQPSPLRGHRACKQFNLGCDGGLRGNPSRCKRPIHLGQVRATLHMGCTMHSCFLPFWKNHTDLGFGWGSGVKPSKVQRRNCRLPPIGTTNLNQKQDITKAKSKSIWTSYSAVLCVYFPKFTFLKKSAGLPACFVDGLCFGLASALALKESPLTRFSTDSPPPSPPPYDRKTGSI